MAGDMGHEHHMGMNHSQHFMGEATTIGHNHAAMGHDHAAMGHDHAAMGNDHAAMGHDHAAMNHGAQMVHNMDNGHMGMKMYFHFGTDATILFDWWKVSTWQGMLGSCIAIFIMAMLYEGLKVLREYLLRKNNVMVRYNSMPVPSNEDVVVMETHRSASEKNTQWSRMLSLAHALQTFLHLIQIVVSYFLMLIFMTYNMWLCIATALGATAGYFIFSWRRAVVVDINEHCH